MNIHASPPAAVQKQPHHVDVYVGQLVKALRLQRGLSQQRLGEDLGLTFQQVQKYEKGTNRISVSRLWEIAAILGVTPGYFYEGLSGPLTTAPAPISTTSLKLNRHFNRIESPAVREQAILLIKALADAGVK